MIQVVADIVLERSGEQLRQFLAQSRSQQISMRLVMIKSVDKHKQVITDLEIFTHPLLQL